MRNLLSFFKKTPQIPEHFIALDFGTTSTKAFIYSLDEQVQLLGKGKGTPSEAVDQAETQAKIRPKKAVVGIGGKNCWCLTTTIRLNRSDAQKPIDLKEVEKLKEQIFKTALLQASPQMSQFFGDPEIDPQLIDSEVLFYKIDGKVVADVGTKQGGNLEASIFTAYSPRAHLTQLGQTLNDLGLDLWAVSSLMSIFVKTLAAEDLLGYNAIILDIGGKVTDIAVVFGGGIWGTRPLSLGGDTFTKALSSEEKKIAYATHQLRDEEVPKTQEQIEAALELYLAGVEEALADFEGIKSFPQEIVLLGGGSRLEDIKRGLSNYPLLRALPFASPPRVTVQSDIGPWNMELIAKDILSGRES